MNPIKELSDVECIFRYWNRLNIIQHRKITSDMEAAIKKALKEYDKGELEQAIFNYDYILNSEDYFFKYRWTISEFLSRRKCNNIERFLNLEVAKQNFKKNSDKQKEIQNKQDGYANKSFYNKDDYYSRHVMH
jgi:hypothetical protein